MHRRTFLLATCEHYSLRPLRVRGVDMRDSLIRELVRSSSRLVRLVCSHRLPRSVHAARSSARRASSLTPVHGRLAARSRQPSRWARLCPSSRQPRRAWVRRALRSIGLTCRSATRRSPASLVQRQQGRSLCVHKLFVLTDRPAVTVTVAADDGGPLTIRGELAEARRGVFQSLQAAGLENQILLGLAASCRRGRMALDKQLAANAVQREEVRQLIADNDALCAVADAAALEDEELSRTVTGVLEASRARRERMEAILRERIALRQALVQGGSLAGAYANSSNVKLMCVGGHRRYSDACRLTQATTPLKMSRRPRALRPTRPLDLARPSTRCRLRIRVCPARR